MAAAFDGPDFMMRKGVVGVFCTGPRPLFFGDEGVGWEDLGDAGFAGGGEAEVMKAFREESEAWVK